MLLLLLAVEATGHDFDGTSKPLVASPFAGEQLIADPPITEPVSVPPMAPGPSGDRTDDGHAGDRSDASTPADRQPLTWRLQPGREYRVLVERVLTQKAVSNDWTETIQYQLIWTVGAVDDEGMRLSQTVDAVVHSIEFSNGVVIRYDSSQPGDPRGDATVLARFWLGRLNNRRSLLMNAQGSFVPTEATAPDAVANSLVGVPSGGDSRNNPSSNLAAATASTNTTSLPSGGFVKPAMPAVPSGVVSGDWSPTPKDLLDADWTLPARGWAVGDTWSDARLVAWNSIAEALRLTANYRYVGEESIEGKRLDKIEVSMVWEDLTPADTLHNFAIVRQLGIGTIYFDSAEGHLASSRRDQQLVVDVTGTDGEPTRVEVVARMNVRCEPIEAKISPELEVTADP